MTSIQETIDQMEQSIAELEAKFTSEQLQDIKALNSLRQMLDYLHQQQMEYGV